MTRTHNAQQGSVFVYILLAIALLGGLTYAVSSGNRSNTSALTAEQAKLAAQEIIEYGNTVAQAVQKLRLRGCADTEISFEKNGNYINPNAPPDKSCNVFDIGGGGVEKNLGYVYFDGSVEIAGVGETNSNAANTELLFMTRTTALSGGNLGYSLETGIRICGHINQILFGNNTVPDEGDITRVPFLGEYTYETVATEFPNRLSACVAENTTGTYTYYQVLIAR